MTQTNISRKSLFYFFITIEVAAIATRVPIFGASAAGTLVAAAISRTGCFAATSSPVEVREAALAA